MSYPKYENLPSDYIKKITTKIPYKFKDMQGNEWCNSWIDTYNLLTEKIVKYLKHDETREFYLDQRHKQYVQFLDICKNTRVAEFTDKNGKTVSKVIVV